MKRSALALLITCSCSSPPPVMESATAPLMDFEGRFFDAPFPTPGRLRDDGTIDVADFPGPSIALKQKIVDQLGKFGEGYGRSTASWIRFSGDLDVSALPKLGVTPTLDDAVYLADLEDGSLVPLAVQFKSAQETYSPKGLLVAVPFQGHVMRGGTWHALVMTRRAKGADGLFLPRAAFMTSTSGGGAKAEALRAELPRLKTFLEGKGRSLDEVVGCTLFRTGSHWERLKKISATARAVPAVPNGAITKLREHAWMVVLEGHVDVPMYQRGEEPYSSDGDMVFDANGNPVAQRTETIRFSLTIPRKPMPAAGFPVLFHVPGSGGDHLAIVDRGSGMGNGLAKNLAEHGIAAFGVEANLTGPRAPGGSGDGEIFYNVFNPVALRDNHRQQAAEYEVLATLVKGLRVDGALTLDTGVAMVKLDPAKFYVHGHSTGSVVGASIIASNDAFSAAALSGAGGSWLYNLVLKQTPASAELVKPLLGYVDGDTVDIFDPVLSLAATMWEPIEPMNQAEGWAREVHARAAPISVLLIEGITDTYYLPRMVNALAMAARMEVAAPAVDTNTPVELMQVGSGERAAPFSGNRAPVTLGLVQHLARPGRNGHFVVFEDAAPAWQYGCFFASAAEGRGPVVAPATVGTVCP